jgi:hypothetical protein
MDPDVWFLKFRFRGGREEVFPVSGPDNERLWARVQRTGDFRFAVFRAGSSGVALNLDHALYAHFLFEPPNRIVELDEGEPAPGVRVLFAGETEYHAFEVDADEPEPVAEDELDEGQLRNLMVGLDMSTEADDVVSFMDVDGETVFMRASDIVLLEIPLWALHPELDDSDDLGASDDHE